MPTRNRKSAMAAATAISATAGEKLAGSGTGSVMGPYECGATLVNIV